MVIDARRRWWASFWLMSALLVLVVVSLAPYLTSGTELVRLRNSLLYDAQPAEAADLAAWTVVGNVLLNLDEMFMKR